MVHTTLEGSRRQAVAGPMPHVSARSADVAAPIVDGQSSPSGALGLELDVPHMEAGGGSEMEVEVRLVTSYPISAAAFPSSPSPGATTPLQW
jgi:hypothetical protein